MKRTIAIIPVSRFTHAKTRLSPTLSPLERENLLKSMLKDVISALKETIADVVVISSDKEVLDFLKPLQVLCLHEKGKTDLNGALEQAIKWCHDKTDQVLIVPSDVPLISVGLVHGLLNMAQEKDVVIAPAKGGGTNAIICPTQGMNMYFGDYSFFKHIKKAHESGLNFGIFDSFYLSLDVNTAEDLGEIILHGNETETQKYLISLGLIVHNNRGTERLKVERI
jgi:2-phospho-L-lactate guanylyltransferase